MTPVGDYYHDHGTKIKFEDVHNGKKLTTRHPRRLLLAFSEARTLTGSARCLRDCPRVYLQNEYSDSELIDGLPYSLLDKVIPYKECARSARVKGVLMDTL